MSPRAGYTAIAAGLFVVEVAIALWVRDRFLRPVGGDVLAVVLLYCGLRAVTRLRVLPAALVATAIGFAVEAGQALHLVDRLGLGDSAVARTVLGSSFALADLFAYAAGGALVILVERVRR
ncbi:MAG: DUF2809 domain-containing protein [Pseudomonadota bacterium]